MVLLPSRVVVGGLADGHRGAVLADGDVIEAPVADREVKELVGAGEHLLATAPLEGLAILACAPYAATSVDAGRESVVGGVPMLRDPAWLRGENECFAEKREQRCAGQTEKTLLPGLLLSEMLLRRYPALGNSLPVQKGKW